MDNRRDDILYLCDRKACDNCSYPKCKHTSDFRHAKNFIVTFQNSRGGRVLIETENIDASLQQGD